MTRPRLTLLPRPTRWQVAWAQLRPVVPFAALYVAVGVACVCGVLFLAGCQPAAAVEAAGPDAGFVIRKVTPPWDATFHAATDTEKGVTCWWVTEHPGLVCLRDDPERRAP